MALPRPPLNPAQAIPNNPFFSTQTNYIQGATGPLVVGAGLLIDYTTGTIFATGGGGGGIATVSGTAPIVVTSGPAPVVSIASSSTTQSGAVQLFNGVNSNSTALALTAAQGKLLQDQITALVVAGTIELAGTIDASTGFVASTTSVGNTDGYTVGAVLPAASFTTNNTYVIVTEPGTMTPPGGVSTVATRGDYFLVSETSPGTYAWTFLNVGSEPPYATDTIPGVVCLSTNALAQAGTDTTTALTPASAASAYIPKTCITAKGDLIAGTAANTPAALTVGTNGQVLLACSTAPSGVCWGPVPAATPALLGTVCGCTCLGAAALGGGALASQLYNAGYNNVALGCNAGNRITTGFKNIAIGSFALECGTTMSDNIGIGVEALRRNTTGTGNIGIGTDALVFNTTGVSNVAIGFQASQANTTGSGSVAIGTNAANNVTGLSRSVLVGEFTMVNSSGTIVCNVGVGWSALENATGNSNTAIGTAAGAFLTTGGNNVAIGFCAQVPFGNQFNQLAIGYNAGCNWLTGDGDKHIKPGAGIRDVNGNLGTGGQVLTSTGSAIQWASGPSKQYLYALVGQTGVTINSVSTLALAGISAGGGLGVVFNSVTLTVGKTYLLTVSLTNFFRNSVPIVRWKTNAGQVGPEIYNEYSYIPVGSSWIYSPGVGTENVQLQLATGQIQLRQEASSMTIVEI